MIVYTNQCLACTNKNLWKKIKAFALTNNLPLEERRVGKNPKWKLEAESYEIERPFAVNGKVAISLTEDLGKLL